MCQTGLTYSEKRFYRKRRFVIRNILPISILSENNERKRILSQEELDRLLAETPQHASDIILTAYFTGMRAVEIFNLKWSRVSLDAGYIQLEAEDTKAKEPRRIYFNKTVREILVRRNEVRHLKIRVSKPV